MKSTILRELTRLTKLLVVLSLVISGHVAPARTFSDAWPRASSADLFHLNGQTFGLNGARPPFGPLAFSVEDGALVVKAGKAWHRFETIRPRTFSIDRDLLTLVDVDGVVHSIELNILNGVVFRAPVPVFTLVQLDNDHLQSPTLESRYVDEAEWRRLKPTSASFGLHPLDRPGNYRWHAGDFTLLDREGGKTRVVAELDRTVMSAQIKAAITVLSHWVDLLHPEGGDHVRPEVGAALPQPAAMALRRLDPDTLRRLTPLADYWLGRERTERDVFQMIGDRPVAVPTLDNGASRITPLAMLKIAGATLGGAALIEAANRLGFDLGFAELVHYTLDNWQTFAPWQLTDSAYRFTLAKAAFWLGIVPPLIFATAYVADKTVTHFGDPKKTWTHGGKKFFATFNVPFWRFFPALLRQPHLIKALSLDLNPGERFDPESTLGRRAGITRPTRVGVVPMFNVGEARREAVANTAALLKVKEDQRNDRISMAQWLALTVVAEESGLDPATVAALELTTLKATEDAARTPGGRVDAEVNQRRRELAMKLSRDLRTRPDDYDVKNLSERELNYEFQLARAAATRMKYRTGLENFVARGRYEWDNLVARGLRGLYTFARAENEFWNSAIPTDFVATTGWRKFLNDYYIGMVYTMFIGPRADKNHPESLVAREGEIGSVNPGARFDIADTARWYTANHSAIHSRVWMDKLVPDADTTYDRREATNLRMRYEAPGVVEEFMRYARDFVNPSSGRYGEVLLKKFMVAVYMWQTSMLLTTGARMFFAGSSLDTSLKSFAYHWIWGHIGVGIIWDWIDSSNERMETHYARNRYRMEAAKDQIGQALRLNDPVLANSGVKDMLSLYGERPDRTTPEMNIRLEELRAHQVDGVSMDQARELLEMALMKPPLPGKNPNWLVRGMATVGVSVSTYLGLRMSVPTFAEHVDWSYLIKSSAVEAGLIYIATYVGLKLWRGHQKRGRSVCEDSLVAPSVNLDPQRAATHYM